jgi:trehalose 6-phosphate phosphatase
VVAVVSGRPASEVRAILGIPDLILIGMYGLSDADAPDPSVRAAHQDLEAAARAVPGAWVEDKGASLALHYRAAPDPVDAERLLRSIVEPLAQRNGLTLVEGKMVLELAPAGLPGKGAPIERIVQARRLEGCLYAGDDAADLDAFAALDRLAASGLTTVRVAVRTEETPPELIAAADIVVDRPAGLLALFAEQFLAEQG